MKLAVHRVSLDFPYIDAPVYRTAADVMYLREAGVVLIGQTVAHLEGVRSFVNSFGIPNYDRFINDPTELAHGTLLSMFAGKLCYMALGDGGTQKDKAPEYIDRIKTEKHGSVLEHPVYTMLFYGIDRAVTHELVRHRAGKAYSQLSQRYVGPDKLRYVMPFEMQGDPELEEEFFRDIRDNVEKYKERIERITDKRPSLTGESKTDKRKRFQSYARRVLANEVEAPIVVSGNVRSWRHVCTKRLAKGADIGIRRPMMSALQILQHVNPEGFNDFENAALPDGSVSSTPKYEGV